MLIICVEKKMALLLKKQLKIKDAKIERLEAKIKKLQKDYDVLLESATEPEVTE